MCEIPIIYRLWFQYFEPICAIIGAYLAYFRPSVYLRMTHISPRDDLPLPLSTIVIAGRVAALYLCFGLAEAFVTRSTADLGVWKTLFWCMLPCDLVYLSCLRGLGGTSMYWVKPWMWDASGWGNFGTTWGAILFRCFFLCGVGLPAQH
jgi:hypothetical protein